MRLSGQEERKARDCLNREKGRDRAQEWLGVKKIESDAETRGADAEGKLGGRN